MPSIRRFRFWQKPPGAAFLGDALTRAGAAGESVERLVELTARSLLETGEADRAAVWLRSEREAGVLEGKVVDAASAIVPESWMRFAAPLPAMAGMLKSREPMLLNLREVAWATVLAPLAGMKAAALLPLWCSGEALGVALVAYRTEPVPEALDSLEGIANHLAVTVSQRRMASLSKSLDDKLNAYLSLERSVAAGDPAEGILKRLAQITRRDSGASFVAIARRSDVGNGVSFAAFDGPGEIIPLLGGEGMAFIWRGVASGRRVTVENLHPVPASRDWGQALRRQGTDMVLVLPLEAGGDLLGVLTAGFGVGESPVAARKGLELLAALGARALREDALRARAAATEAMFTALLESGSEMVLLLDGSGCIRHSSRAAREKLNLGSSNGESPRLAQIFPTRLRARVAAWREAIMPGGRLAPLELTLDDGTILRLSVQATLLPGGGWQVGLEDLTAARSAERRRMQSAAELSAVLESMESGMLLFDVHGGVRLINSRFAHLLGLEPRQLAEIENFEGLLGAVRDRFREPRAVERRWREILAHGSEAAWDELEVAHPSRRVVERFARPVLDGDGQRIGWLELYRDITGERLIQSKLLQAEKMAAVGQLVSGIAHELNNPLTGIMGYAQLLLSRQMDSASPGATEARRIFEEAERAGRIVKNLLMFAREKKPERKPVNVNEIIERTLALRSYELKVENIAIVTELDADLPATLADAHQLQQVLLNLLVNAEQAIQQGRGSGRITVRSRRISPQRIALSVADDGPGIPPEISSRIFDPFFTTKPVGVGTGLGLSIVYGIVQEHGGEVAVETRPEQGTEFVIELPVLAGHAEKTPEERPRNARTSAVARGRKILVIEDEPTVAQLVVDVLREEGHHAEALLDSIAALDRLQREHFDLVICDLRMPRLDGRDLYLSLVRHGNSAQHRIIFITGDTLTPRTVEFLERNSLRYLAKPFLVEELKQAVEQVLENERPALKPRPRLVSNLPPADQGRLWREERSGQEDEHGPTVQGSKGLPRR